VQLVVAEKPQVARDLARVLGVPARGKGAFRGARHVITWCVGHLVEIDEPAAQDPAWKRWRLDRLPMLPERFRLRPARGTIAQWRVVRELLRSGEFTEVVNACDAGREGELIFRLCCDLAGARPRAVKRLWVSSLTDGALRAGLAALRPGADFDALADAARSRSEADWLVGMNATRALTVQAGGRARLLSVGRVQTPTLAIVVAREAAIRAFVPETYAEVVGRFRGGPEPVELTGTWTRDGETRLAPEAAAAIVARDTRAGDARVESVERVVDRQPPPLLFDLTSLQRAANGRFGMSARRALDVAQRLYERHKALTYPRTDSRHLPEDARGELPGIFDALAADPRLAGFVGRARAASGRRLPRVFDDRRVGDHHAIVPTGKRPGRLDADEQRLYDLVARSFLCAFFPDAEIERSSATLVVEAAAAPGAPEPPDRYLAKGKLRLVAGWQEVAGIEGDAAPLPPIAAGDRLAGTYQAVRKQTEPPRRLTEAALLAAMESAGREIVDEELRAAMKEHGLGTPATRAQIIETLLERGYLVREGKALAPTPLGEELIRRVPVPTLASPELTGRWEARLARMARGAEERERFMADIAGYVREVVDAVRAAPPPPAVASVAAAPPVGRCPRCGGEVRERFKAYECASCDFKLWKRIAGKAIAPALAGLLLRTRRSRTLRGFRSKAGKRFAAALVLDESGARFDFATERGPPIAARCPRCKTGTLIAGRRAWGCSRWNEGCPLVVPFEAGGRKVTAAQLKALVEKGVTRRTKAGRLRLDLAADPPVVRIEA
jgi:DNA topoisomerase-3